MRSSVEKHRQEYLCHYWFSSLVFPPSQAPRNPNTYETQTIMDAPITDQKPSAEIQAVVMQLWNVVRETSQASAGAVSERNALSKKYAAIEITLQQEAQKTAKMQSYIEHLQEEARLKEEEFIKLQQQYRDIQEISRHREETIQELRRSVMEQEEQSAKLNILVQEQARNIEERVRELVAQEDELEQLREELDASNERAMASAQELGELQPLYIDLQEEKVLLTQETEQLRWQLTAVTEQTSQERAELEATQERKLTDAHAENGRLLVEMEEFKRLWNESEQRIRVLEAERGEASAKIETAIQQAQQDTLAWQQIAEEQEQTFAARERTLREELATATNDSERVSQLQNDLQAAQKLLILEKAAHDQALQALSATHAQEREHLQASLSAELEMVRAELAEVQQSAETQAAKLTEAHTQAITRLEQDLEASQNLMDEKQQRFVNERETLQQQLLQTQNAHTQASERITELETNLLAQVESAREQEHRAAEASNHQAEEELLAKLAEQQTAQQARFDEALEQYKREAQIRLEMELDVSRQVLSMKDREIDLLRANIETLQATTTRAEASADEREVRITELEALLRDLEAQRTKLEHTLETAPHLPSMSDFERTQLAGKVRQMLSRVEAALEEEVR
jgi:chromosome segregation ATPase